MTAVVSSPRRIALALAAGVASLALVLVAGHAPTTADASASLNVRPSTSASLN